MGYPSVRNGVNVAVPLASLSPAVGLRTGTAYEITDYGGNIATAVNGVWRFEYPFRTTWANRPPVNLVPVGTELQVTDYANQKWVSDGINWRPAQGRAIITQQHGNATQPLATLSGITKGYFTIPGGNPIIKGGMILYHSRVYIEILTRKIGTGGLAVFYARLAKVGASSYPDSTCAILTLGNNNLQCIRLFSTANFGTSKTQFLTPQQLAPAGGAIGIIVDKASQINTDVDMEVTMTIASANVADSFELLSFAVWLEA